MFARKLIGWTYRALARLAPLLRTRGRRPERVHRVVVMRLFAVGELVMATAALQALRLALPDATIDLLVGDSLVPLAEGLPWVDRVIAVDERALTAGRPRALLHLVSTLRRGRYDVGLCMHQSAVLGLTMVLGGVRWRVGFDRAGEGATFHVRVPCNRPHRHQAEEYLDTVRALCGADESERALSATPALRWTPAADEAAAHLLQGLRGRTLVGLAPTGGMNVAASSLGTNVHLKRWPPDHYVTLARILAGRPDITVVLVGGAAERDTADRMRDAVRHARGDDAAVLDLVEQTPLPVLAAVLSRLHLLVTNDSGPMHMAAAVGTPVIALFGPTDERLTGPLGARVQVLRQALPCAPCFRKDTVPPSFPDCRHQQCLTSLTPDFVLQAVLASLA